LNASATGSQGRRSLDLCMPGIDRTVRPGVTPARIVRLGTPESEDLSATTTVAERVEMVALLTRRMWEFTGRSFPAYARDEMPVKILRRR